MTHYPKFEIDNSNMLKLIKRANRYVYINGRTDPNYRKDLPQYLHIYLSLLFLRKVRK